MAPNIHSTALVDAAAQLDPTVTVGPYAVIGPHVQIGARTSIGAHCVIEGHTRIGEDNRIFQFSSLGAAPQDKKYAGEPTRLEIGHRNTIREFCTFNVGTVQDRGVTTIGDDNWIMAYVHIAHDCVVGNQTILANNATLAGHVQVGDQAIIGGLTGVHQFSRIGAHVMAGFASRISQDVPPFMMVDGNPLAVRGLNLEGCADGVFPRSAWRASSRPTACCTARASRWRPRCRPWPTCRIRIPRRKAISPCCVIS